MSHLRRSSTTSAARIGRPFRLLSILAAATLVAGCLAYVAITTMATAPRAPADLQTLAARTGQATAAVGATAATAATATTTPGTAVPPAPAGWATVFKDGFAGPAGSAPAAANWHPLIACRGSKCESGYHTYSVIANRANMFTVGTATSPG